MNLRATAILICCALLPAAAAATDEQYLEDKAYAFAIQHVQMFMPGYGGAVHVIMTEPFGDTVDFYTGEGDSTIWTGTYLAGEALRYGVTGDEDAKENAIAAVHALDTHLHITQVPGFIARYAGPDVYVYNRSYAPNSDRYHQGTGEWAGSFWVGETSRDQYTGWWFGMALAYDLIDDDDTRKMIADDVREVIDEIRADNYMIIDEAGEPTDAAPQVLGYMAADWHLIAAHILDEPYYWELYYEARDKALRHIEFETFSFFNKYDEYYGFNLSHQTFFNLVRLEPDPAYRWQYLEAFTRNIRSLTAWTHNAYFDFIWLSLLDHPEELAERDAIVEDALLSLEQFPESPKWEVQVFPPETELDPFAVFITDLMKALGLEETFGFEYQTLKPHRMSDRCIEGFIWQRSPYVLECDASVGWELLNGVDYMVGYWLGRYFDFVPPGNPNGPPDRPDDDDDDDDDDAVDDDDDDSAGGDDDDDDDENCCG